LKDLVLGQNKGELELIRAKNMKILYKNILCKEFEDPSPKYKDGAPHMELPYLASYVKVVSLRQSAVPRDI